MLLVLRGHTPHAFVSLQEPCDTDVHYEPNRVSFFFVGVVNVFGALHIAGDIISLSCWYIMIRRTSVLSTNTQVASD